MLVVNSTVDDKKHFGELQSCILIYGIGGRGGCAYILRPREPSNRKMLGRRPLNHSLHKMVIKLFPYFCYDLHNLVNSAFSCLFAQSNYNIKMTQISIINGKFLLAFNLHIYLMMAQFFSFPVLACKNANQ